MTCNKCIPSITENRKFGFLLSNYKVVKLSVKGKSWNHNTVVGICRGMGVTMGTPRSSVKPG
jgi:hypothetical protein